MQETRLEEKEEEDYGDEGLSAQRHQSKRKRHDCMIVSGGERLEEVDERVKSLKKKKKKEKRRKWWMGMAMMKKGMKMLVSWFQMVIGKTRVREVENPDMAEVHWRMLMHFSSQNPD